MKPSSFRASATPSLAVLLALSLAAPGGIAEHRDAGGLSWHALSSGIGASRIAIYDGRKMIGIYDLDCDLTIPPQQDPREGGATLETVAPDSHPHGLLLITCDLGAHSQLLSIIDPRVKGKRPVYSRDGSYFVAWELQDGELWISYDRPCAGGESSVCPDGFETLFEPFPRPPGAATSD